MVKPATILTLLSLNITSNKSLHQPNINNAFYMLLSEQVFVAQPLAFPYATFLNYVCKLQKTFYSLKQEPRAWYNKLNCFLWSFGFKWSIVDVSLFIYHHHIWPMYLIFYVDHIILTSPNLHALDNFVNHFSWKFALKNLGSLFYFVGVEVISTK